MKETRWTLIRNAALGVPAARQEFAEGYGRVLRSYLRTRWGKSPLRSEIEDAIQEVFLACFRAHGALEKAEPDHGSGFRAYLYGVTRNVARQYERGLRREEMRRGAAECPIDDIPDDAPELSTVFDRAYAKALLQRAAERMRQEAANKTAAHVRRIELLELRFYEGHSIQQIAARWGVENKWLHHQYEQAQKEFRKAFHQVVGESEGLAAGSLDRECEALLAALQ